MTKALKERACEFGDWVYLLRVDRRRFLWTGFIRLLVDSGDFCGLGLSVC